MAKKKSNPKIPKRRQRPEPQMRMVDPKDIKVPTKLLHEQLEPEQEALARYTYKHCGYLLYGNYEQWESGFLRERDPDNELMFWLKMAATLQAVALPDDDAKRKFMGDICAGEQPKEALEFWQKMDAAPPEERERYVIEAMMEFDPTYEPDKGE